MGKPKGPPLWAVDAAKKVSRKMTWLQRRMAPPSAALLELVSGVWRPHAISLVAELGIADLLADGPKDLETLAARTHTHAASLGRVLRPLAHDGIFATPAPDTYALTALSRPLCTDHPKSIRQTLRRSMSEYNQRTWSQLRETVRSGEPAFPRLHGGHDLWTWFAESAPEAGRVFHDSMAELTRLTLPLILSAHDFGRYTSVLDVGGGRGTLMAGLLKAHPRLRGGVFDVDGVLSDEALEAAGVRDRCELIEGSLYGALPVGWDAYVMKHMLHSAPDAVLADILAKARAVLTPHARLIVMEMLLPDAEEGVYPAHLDLQMLLSNGGRERSAEQYRDLFAAHGLRLEEVARTASPLSLLIVARHP